MSEPKVSESAKSVRSRGRDRDPMTGRSRGRGGNDRVRDHRGLYWPDKMPIVYGQAVDVAGVKQADIVSGFEYKIIKILSDQLSLSQKDIAQYIDVSPSTVSRRREEGLWHETESDKLYRLQRIVAAARSFFNEEEAASAWIKSEVRGLGYKKPIEMVRTTAGYDMVVDLLGRLSDGVVT